MHHHRYQTRNCCCSYSQSRSFARPAHRTVTPAFVHAPTPTQRARGGVEPAGTAGTQHHRPVSGGTQDIRGRYNGMCVFPPRETRGAVPNVPHFASSAGSLVNHYHGIQSWNYFREANSQFPLNPIFVQRKLAHLGQRGILPKRNPAYETASTRIQYRTIKTKNCSFQCHLWFDGNKKRHTHTQHTHMHVNAPPDSTLSGICTVESYKYCGG